MSKGRFQRSKENEDLCSSWDLMDSIFGDRRSWILRCILQSRVFALVLVEDCWQLLNPIWLEFSTFQIGC
jgi:hypothetical protein